MLGPLVDLMIEAGPHIALGLGDHVEEGSEASQWDDHLFGPARALFHQVPFFATRGNHEQNPMHFLDAYQYDLPQDPLDVATYYKFTYGNAFFLVIESNTLVCPIGDYNPPQFDFIKAALESPEAKAATWRFAFTHEAAYSEAWPTFEGDLCIRDTILPMLDQAGFHGFFAGHTHSYERGIVGGILHIISGGGGGGLDTWARDLKPTTVVYLGHHFLRIDAGCEQLKLEAVALDGTVIDWVVLSPEHQILSQGTAGGLDGLILTP